MNKNKSIVNKLLLDTKSNIPFPSARLTIYQPSVKELSFIPEENFFLVISALTKNYHEIGSNTEDKVALDELSNFDIFMSMIKEKTEASKRIFTTLCQLFDLLFPDYTVGATPRSFIFKPINSDSKEVSFIDANNFDDFAQIIYEMFAMVSFSGTGTQEYNPQGDRALKLVEKFKKRHELLAKLKQERGEDTETSSVFGRYINILAVGLQKDKNMLSNYSVYQLIEEVKRFELKEAFDYTLQAKMAGAKNVKDAKDWTQENCLISVTQEE